MTTPARTTPATPEPRAARGSAVRNTLLVIAVLNVAVLAIKIGVGVHTRSLSLLGAALESGLDLLNNALGIVLVGIASHGPDEEHPYGHEKFETLGALAVVGLLSISCFELLREGVRLTMEQHTPHAPTTGQLALVASTLVVNLFVGWYERRQGERLGSVFLTADATHTHSDVYVTGAALGSLILTRYGLGFVDPLLAIAVAVIIAINGYHIVRGSVPVLVDERAVKAEDIRRIIESIPHVRDVRAVRSRSMSSGVLLVEATIAVDGSMPVEEAHHVADAVEERLGTELDASQVTVHVEPA